MKLQEWINARPEVVAKIKAAVDALDVFGDFARNTDLSAFDTDQKRDAHMEELRKKFSVLDECRKEAEAMMPPMSMIASIDSLGDKGDAEFVELLGWEFETSYDSTKEPRAFLKYRPKDAQVSYYTQAPHKVNIKDDVL
mgnify:CR=1 FL=1